MNSPKPVPAFHPSPTSRLGALDPSIIAKAEAALKGLSDNFTQWLNDEIAKLDAARQAIGADGVTAEGMERLYLRAHDLKGLGTTYGYPFITQVAGLLCRLIDDKSKRLSTPLSLIDAHIEAIKRAVRDDIKTDDHPAGKILVEDLSAQARQAGA